MDGLIQEIQSQHTRKEMVAKLFYQHGLFCASHPYFVIFFSGIFIISFSFPAFSVLHLTLSGASPLEYRSLVNMARSKSSLPINTHDHPPVWLSGVPLATIQQVVFVTKKSNDQRTPDLTHLQAAFSFSELLSQLSFQNDSGQQVSWRSICLNEPNILTSLSCGTSAAYQDVRHTSECLLLGPDLFWQRSSLSFQQDASKEHTIYQVLSSLSCLPKSIVQDLLFGGLHSDMSLKDQHETFAVTLLLDRKSKIEFQALHTALEARLRENESYVVSTNNETVNFFYSVSFANLAEVVFIVLLYVIVLLYITFSVGKIEMVKSKWGLGFTAVITTLCSLAVSLGVCVKFRRMPVLNGGEVFPYLVILVGLENILVLVKAVVSTPKYFDVNRRIAQGWSVEGWSIFKNFVGELALFFIGYLTGHPVLQDFCLLAVAGVSSDFLLQTFFFTSVLSIDMRQMEMVDVATKSSDTNSNEQQSAVPVSHTGGSGSTSIAFQHKRCDRINGHIPSRGLISKLHVTSAHTPRRLSLAYFIARTRLVQRLVMISFMCYVVYLTYSSVVTPPVVAKDLNHSVLPVEALQKAYDVNLGLFSRQHWPMLLKLYNKTTNGRYITVLPPLFVQVRSDNSHESIMRTQQQDGGSISKHQQSLANPLQFLKLLSGDSEMSPHQKAVAFATIFVLFTVVGLWYVIELYKCVIEDTLLCKESRHSQIFPHLRPFTLKQHEQEVECVAVDTCLAASSCLGGVIQVWDLESGRCKQKIVRWSSHSETRQMRPQSAPVPRLPDNGGVIHRTSSLADRSMDVQNCDYCARGERSVTDMSVVKSHLPVGQSDMKRLEIPWSLAIRGKMLAIGYKDGIVQVCYMTTESQCTIGDSDSGVLCCDFADASGNRLVVGRMDGSVGFYSIQLGNDCVVRSSFLKSVQAHHEPVSHLKCGGGYAVSGSADQQAKVFNIHSCLVTATLTGHLSDITALCLHEASKTIVSGSADCTVCLWHIVQGNCLWTADGHVTSILSVDRNHNVILSTAADGEVRLLDALTGNCNHVIQEACNFCFTSALLHSNVVVCGSKGCILIYDSVRGHLLKVLELSETENNEIRSTVQHMIPISGRSGVICSYGNQLKLVNLPIVSNSS